MAGERFGPATGRVAPLRRIYRGGTRSRRAGRWVGSHQAHRHAPAPATIQHDKNGPIPWCAANAARSKGTGPCDAASPRYHPHCATPASRAWCHFCWSCVVRRPSARLTCSRVRRTAFFSRPLQGLFPRACVPPGSHRPWVAVGQPRGTLPLRRGPERSIARRFAICQAKLWSGQTHAVVNGSDQALDVVVEVSGAHGLAVEGEQRPEAFGQAVGRRDGRAVQQNGDDKGLAA